MKKNEELMLKLDVEQRALNIKLDRLNKFLVSEECKELSEHARDLLLMQSGVIEQYSSILHLRIEELR